MKTNCRVSYFINESGTSQAFSKYLLLLNYYWAQNFNQVYSGMD